MTRTRKGRKPSPQSVADRGRTTELVRMTGRERVVFTVGDVRERMKGTSNLKLHRPDRLSHHMAALEGELVRLAGQGDLVPGQNPSRGARRRYVLIERWREFKAGHWTLDDPERALVALHLAVILAGGEAVPTSAVTAVMRAVPDLNPETDSPTASQLQNLATPPRSLARLESNPGGGRQLWLPIGEMPDHAKVQEWLQEAKRSEDYQSGLLQSRLGSLNLVVQELVRQAVINYANAWGGGGRPVTADEVREVAASCERGKALTGVLRRKGKSLGDVLGDASRTRIDGKPRKEPIIVKVRDPWSGQTFYDVPDEPGYDMRTHYVAFRSLLARTKDAELAEAQQEAQQAKKLLTSEGAVSRAVGAARILLVNRRWQNLVDGLRQLDLSEAGLRTKPREQVKQRLRRMAGIQRAVRELDVGNETSLEKRIQACGLGLAETLDVPRPLLVAEELALWVPQALRDELSPSRFLGQIVGLKRYPNPEYVGPSGTTARERFRVALDRATAIVYIAERITTPMAASLRKAHDFLGPDLRSHALLERLYVSGSEEDQRLALVGLALLGQDELVSKLALDVLADEEVSARLAEGAVHALMVSRQFKVEELPPWLHQCRRPELLGFLRSAVRFARSGLWLMRG
jgi:hypothetical protein